jgi:ketosteroid isomerase-like protein
MNNVNDAIQKARAEAQDLHKKIEASTTKNHAAMRADLQNLAVQAVQLGSSVKTLADSQRADAKQHLKDAAASLEDAAKHAKSVASAGDAEIKGAAQATLSRAREAVQSLSEAVASKRTTAKA